MIDNNSIGSHRKYNESNIFILASQQLGGDIILTTPVGRTLGLNLQFTDDRQILFFF